MATSKELLKLKKHFERNCGVEVHGVLEHKHYFHWKRLLFSELNCEDMIKIADYIKTYFSTPNRYSHLLPKLHSFNDCLCLTFDVSEINKFLK